MIKDKQMIELGFEQKPHYRKKEVDVSKYDWVKDQYCFSIEKNGGSEYENYYQPALRIGNSVFRFYGIEQIKSFISVLSDDGLGLANEINKDIDQPQRGIMNYLKDQSDKLDFISKMEYFELIISSAESYLNEVIETNEI